MLSTNGLARLTGFTYLILIITGIFGIAYVPAKLIVWGNAAQTVSNIHNAEMLFRLAIVSEIICYICFLLLPLFLYELFKSVNKNIAVLMVAFAVISIPVTLLNVVNHINILSLFTSAEYLTKGQTDQFNERVMHLLVSFNNGTLIANIFWGAWLLPLGYLIVRSGLIPKVIGILLMLGCFGYLAEFTMRFLFSVNDIPWYVGIWSTLGEFGICLWLLIFGIREEKTQFRTATNQT